MYRSPRLLALAALLLGMAAWAVAPPTAYAQSNDAVLELSFVTATGDSPPSAVAVLDLNTGTEYRNSGVTSGEPIEVGAATGVASQLQIRRTNLRPSEVTCEGASSAQVITTSRGPAVTVTPDADTVVCTVTLTDAAPEELAVTGFTTSQLAVVGAILVGEGTLVLAAARRSRR